MKIKRCSKCKECKPVSDFYTNKRQSDGFNTYCKDCQKIHNKSYQRNSDLKRKYGITEETYKIMFDFQNGKCAICGKEESATNQHGLRPLVVDHNHETGEVRQLLCHSCNTAIGLMKEDTVTLANAISYLVKHGRKA